MPLTDVVRYLNTRDRDQRPFLRFNDPFQATPTGAIARYAGLVLNSRYAPVRNAVTNQLYGHVAVLTAQGELSEAPLIPDAVFAIPSTNEEFVHLDRLVRTLHTLNYLLHPEARQLFLRVNLRHIESIPSDHGLVFENVLRACGLAPENIALQIETDTSPDASLVTAIESYRTRGYRIAVHRNDADWKNIGWLKLIKPDVLRLNRRNLADTHKLAQLTRRLRREGVLTLVEIEASQIDAAVAAGIDLIQLPAVTPSQETIATQQHAAAA